MYEGERVGRVDDEIEEDEEEREEEDAVAIRIVGLPVLDLCVLQVTQLAVDGRPVRCLQEAALEGIRDLRLDLGEDHDRQVLMHHLHDPAVFLEEVQPWRLLRQLILGVVLEHFIDLEAQRKHHFLLLAELQVLPLVLELQFLVALIDTVEFFDEELVRDGKQLADGLFVDVFGHEGGDETNAAVLDLRGHPLSRDLVLVQVDPQLLRNVGRDDGNLSQLILQRLLEF